MKTGAHHGPWKNPGTTGTPGMGYLISQKMGETEFAPCGKHSWVSMMA